jgi:Protein of unknown function (DUF3618)
MAEGPYEMIRKSDGGFHLAAAKPPSSVTDTEKLRAQIEATRAEMSHTIDEIQARLSPSHLMTQAKAAVREAVTRRAKRLGRRARMATEDLAEQSADARARLARMAKANPVPAAVAGAATMLLLVRALKGRRPETIESLLIDPLNDGAPGDNHAGRSKTRLLIRAASLGFACWGLWKARHSSPRFPPANVPMRDGPDSETSLIGPERIR